ncbi:hypothetical protein QWY79_01540 [Halomonas sabkhae]|uniref:hypothetical protein n=1 Tax=Halomonas sabkhae TaxID=626223 RepID=UPI0025B486FB|nr:hypothetical protein [Halomonas sabkhae]MDN3523946.1 hypothetical protein [Halomonas sabkhae]
MYNNLLAPRPDQRWHASPAVDALVPDNHWLCDLNGTPLVLPQDPRWHPCTDGRLEHLQR